jgi:hypothetical protein
LADAARYNTHEGVWVADFLQGFRDEFRVQSIISSLDRARQATRMRPERNLKKRGKNPIFRPLAHERVATAGICGILRRI